jgi:predicted neutral ceramidase superfamily lipid hydrolase
MYNAHAHHTHLICNTHLQNALEEDVNDTNMYTTHTHTHILESSVIWKRDDYSTNPALWHRLKWPFCDLNLFQDCKMSAFLSFIILFFPFIVWITYHFIFITYCTLPPFPVQTCTFLNSNKLPNDYWYLFSFFPSSLLYLLLSILLFLLISFLFSFFFFLKCLWPEILTRIWETDQRRLSGI